MRTGETKAAQTRGDSSSEEGYLLLGLVVVLFLIALFATLAAPTVARELERDKELESEHRAQQYVRAIQLYYRKNHAYPNSVEQLLGSTGQGSVTSGASLQQRYLREQYKDPLTGGDYRLIHLGEQKTEVKGFFGEPLEGFAQGSLGAVAGQASGIGTGLGGQSGLVGGLNGNGSTPSGGFGSGTSSSAGPISTAVGPAVGAQATSGPGSSGSGNGSTDTSSTLGGTSATSFQGSKGQIVGVGSNKTGAGIVEWNSSANIEDWEFLYDPRVEILKQRVSIFGGTPAQSGTGSLGMAGGSTNGLGSNTPSFGSSSAGSSTGGLGTSSGTFGGSGSSSGTSGSSGPSTTPQ